jgi:chromosome segregation protein
VKLTTLEIKGFKSFADKTTLHFNENVTGIVGPNGCGKSNVVDAIRWVLGEQKPTAIRTEKMENLIFNGTKARKPSALAEVSLTFENTRNLLATEFSTVTISRHYFKTGESEYRINGVPCRLKDIHGLFMDTGISTDSYAIIELGMLDDILHNKDNSRRKLFEQAAGISKYKIRKRETLNKLTATQQDLDRVEDILFEIENNLKELEKQAKKAQRYHRLKADYKTNSIDLAVIMLQSNKDFYKQLSNQQTYESDVKGAIETQINTLEAGIADKKAQIIEKEQALHDKQKELNTLQDAIRNKEGENNVHRERVKYLEEKDTTLGKLLDETAIIIANTKSETATLEQKLAEEEEKLAAIKLSLQTFLQELEAVKHEHDAVRIKLEAEQNQFRQIEKTLYETDKKIAVNKVRLENYHRELEHLETDSTQQNEKINPLHEEVARWKQEQLSAKSIYDQLIENDNALKEKIQLVQHEIEEMRRQLADTRRKLDAKRNELQLTKNLYESFDGFPESIKYLKKNVQGMQDAPLLSDIVNTDDTYKTAIESYLDQWLNYYIVQDLPSAIAAIDALDKNDKGRANFFLLEEFNGVTINQPQEPGLIPALEVVSTDARYSSLIRHLLGHVMIVQDADRFQSVSNSIKTNYPHIHLLLQNGKVIKSGKCVTGGSIGLFKGKRLGREKTMQSLQEEIEKIRLEEDGMLNEVKEKEQILSELRKSLADKEIHNATQALNTISQNIVTAQTKLDHIQNVLKQIADKKESFRRMITQTEEESQQLHTHHEQTIGLKDEQQKVLLAMETAYREVNDKLNHHNALYNQENIKYHQQLNRTGSVKQDLNYKQARLNEAESTLAVNNAQLNDVKTELTEIHTTIESTQQELLSLYDEKTVQETIVNTAEQDYYTSREEIAETEDQIKTLQKKKEQTDIVLGGIKDKLNDLKVQLAATKERLWVEFQVELEQILDNVPPENVTLEELQEKVDAAKKRLENYGEINPMAIQAFEEMKTRYDFIKNQREDLLNAKTSLLTTIDEIDATARKKFDDAFIQVRQNFVEVFRGLFSEEDDCDLVLKENSDPLEAEIEIIAKPKGKKPQVLDQLSGGEKTLTGMSLLFALYLLKPAPFCILDEVDAPLDDNNIAKFNNIIRRFSDNSQFIIVTHNKRTMAEVDIIYGVTMAEQGISKVVPVDFRNLN